MAELTEVLRKLGIESSDKSGQTVAQFHLDNGVRELVQWFARVEVERRKGSLVLTEAAALVEYLVSYICIYHEEAVDLHAYFDRELQLKGVFQVSTESGIFKVIKDS